MIPTSTANAKPSQFLKGLRFTRVVLSVKDDGRKKLRCYPDLADTSMDKAVTTQALFKMGTTIDSSTPPPRRRGLRGLP